MPNKAPEPTITAVTFRAPSSTARASRNRGSSLTFGTNMSTSLPTVVLLFAFCWSAAAHAAASLEFSGYLKSNDGLVFIVTDTKSPPSSKWVRLGEPFAGYTVAEFDERQDTLVLRSGDRTLQLLLKESRVQNSDLNPARSVFRFSISPSGQVTIGSRVLDKDAVDELFRACAKSGVKEVALIFEVPDIDITSTSNVRKASSTILSAVRFAGLKRTFQLEKAPKR